MTTPVKAAVLAGDWAPDAGDIVWLHFTPQAGHEQAGPQRRDQGPALVLSPRTYNVRSGLMLCCPLTTRIKGYPFEVAVPGTPASVVLADQVRSLDWRARAAVPKGRVSAAVMRAVQERAVGLIGGGKG